MKALEKKVTCLIGPNGSGKSTVLRTVMGVLKPPKGKIIFKGEDITGLQVFKLVKKGISIIPQGRIIFPNLTVLENIKLGGYPLDDSKQIAEAVEAVFNHFPVLRERKTKKAYTLSGGEQAMLCFGRGLMINPELMMIDEPSLGLAPKLVEYTYDMIEQMIDEGKTIVLVEQNVRKALSIADWVYIIDQGRNIWDGTPSDILLQEKLLDTYLGRVKQTP